MIETSKLSWCVPAERSNAFRPHLAALLLIGGCLAGCTGPLAQRAQRADGLLDFLAGNPGEVNVPIEMIADGGGRIETAQIRVYGKDAFVSGYVARAALGEPRLGAHVDVLVLDARQRVVESHSTTFLPSPIPHGQQGGFAHSRFTARLKAPPSAGATVKVIFHHQPKSNCAPIPPWVPNESNLINTTKSGSNPS